MPQVKTPARIYIRLELYNSEGIQMRIAHLCQNNKFLCMATCKQSMKIAGTITDFQAHRFGRQSHEILKCSLCARIAERLQEDQTIDRLEDVFFR